MHGWIADLYLSKIDSDEKKCLTRHVETIFLLVNLEIDSKYITSCPLYPDMMQCVILLPTCKMFIKVIGFNAILFQFCTMMATVRLNPKIYNPFYGSAFYERLTLVHEACLPLTRHRYCLMKWKRLTELGTGAVAGGFKNENENDIE